MAFRAPRVHDAATIWRMAPQRGTSEHDSCYAYVLLCAHFSDTGVVAEADGAVVGYALAYRIPARQHELFLWQLGVAGGQDAAALTTRVLEELLSRRACADARFLCMTCSPHDLELRERVQQFARRRGVRCAIEPCFPATLFAEPRVDEDLLRVGPLSG